MGKNHLLQCHAGFMKMMFGLETWLDFKWDVEGEYGIPAERKKGGGSKCQQEAGAKFDT